MPVIPAFGKVIQEVYHKFEIILDYIESASPCWATNRDPVSNSHSLIQSTFFVFFFQSAHIVRESSCSHLH